jgi:hypothetical protein
MRSHGRPVPAIDIVLAVRDKRQHGGAAWSAYLLATALGLTAAGLVDLLLALA